MSAVQISVDHLYDVETALDALIASIPAAAAELTGATPELIKEQTSAWQVIRGDIAVLHAAQTTIAFSLGNTLPNPTASGGGPKEPPE